MNNLKESIRLFLEKHPPAGKLFELLETAGEIYLIGGVLREYKDNNKIQNLRDIDIIIDVKNQYKWETIITEYSTEKNKFDGYKFDCEDLLMDIWELKNNWAYRERKIICDKSEYVKLLPVTVFLNIDSIVYDMKRNVWYDDIYQEAMKSRIIDVVLSENPQIMLNIVRAIVLKKRYNMTFSPRLKKIIEEEKNKNENLVDELYKVQKNRYKKTIFTKSELYSELLNISIKTGKKQEIFTENQ